MKWNRSLLGTVTAVIIAALTILSCDKKENGTDDTKNLERRNMFERYAHQYILPGYADLKNDLQTLESAVELFNEAPDEAKLSALKTSWLNAYITWQKVDMLEFGPAEEVSLRNYMNIYPVTTAKVEANITSGTYDLETFGNTDAQGFPAIDYLINGESAAAVIAQFTTDAGAVNRKKYLADIISKMVSKVTTVDNGWQDYQSVFIESTGTDVNGSLSRMVNAYVLYYERFFRSGKIGYPVGAMTGTALPTHCESYYSPEHSKTLAIEALKSIIAFYEGKSYDGTSGGSSMKSYLTAIGTTDDDGTLMSTVISNELNNALSALNGMSVTVKEGVTTDRVQILTIYEQLQKVVALLKVDMVSAFGISITYVDNDGD